MSCWCDGEDPGCPHCHPDMLPEARAAFRAVKKAREALLGRARIDRALDETTDALVLQAAAAYRAAVRERERFDAFGRNLKGTSA